MSSSNSVTFNVSEEISFANVRKPKILRLQELRDKALKAFSTRFGDDGPQIALGFALKFSVSGSNLDRAVPMTVRGHTVTAETFKTLISPKRGQEATEDELTVSRFCASFANHISDYLEAHPDQVRTRVEGVRSGLCFPHNYYVDNLSEEDRNACIAWLTKHDQIMKNVVKGSWRELSLKATAYFQANYGSA
jgi:hypothetical protein